MVPSGSSSLVVPPAVEEQPGKALKEFIFEAKRFQWHYGEEFEAALIAWHLVCCEKFEICSVF